MGTSPPKTTGYVSGENPATVEANRVYQDALARLSQSLDTRKNRFFDPVWLAAAQGFGAPTQTGGFGESLGNAAKSISAAQELDLKQEQEIAQQRVAAAGKGVELQRMRARDADIVRYLQGDQATEPPAKGPLSAAPVAGPGAGAVAGPRAVTLPKVGDKYPYTYGDPIDRKYGESETRTVTQADLDQLQRSPPTGSFISLDKVFEPRAPAVREVPATATGLAAKPGALPASAPVAQAPQGGLSTGYNMLAGIQIMPANPAFMSQKEYVALNRNDPSKSLAELLAKGAELEKQRYEKTEAGIVDYKTGMFNPLASSQTEDTPIFGPGFDGKSYKIPKNIAMMLTHLGNQGNWDAYKALADRATGRTFGRPATEGPAQKGDVTTSQGAPSGYLKSSQELITEAKGDEARAVRLGEADAKKVSSLSDMKATASRIYGSSTRVLDYLKESANFFGIFERTGYGPAILGAVDAGIRTQNGSISIGDLQSAVTKVMPGVSQIDLDNVKKAAAELAEIELQYTKLYVSGDGAITEGERKIVRAIPGTVSNSPGVLRTRMELLKVRSQFDLDVIDAFDKWEDKNPGRPYREFERKSDLYKDIKKSFEAETEKIFGGIKAVPTAQRKQEAANAPAVVQPSPGFIRGPDGVIRRKKAGE